MSKNLKESSLIILLSLLSFGGATGRFSFGVSFFDVLLLIMFGFALIKNNSKLPSVKKTDFLTIGLLFLVIIFGVLVSIIGVPGLGYDYLITELRFFIYIPLLYYISLRYRFNIQIFKKYLPIILIIYLIIWGVLLKEGSFLFRVFNTDIIATIGTEERISGPPVLALVPLLLILIKERLLELSSFLIYLALILLIFIKTGGRTYFIFHLIPVFYLLFINRKSIKWIFVSTLLFIITIFLLKVFTSDAFFQRFLKITDAQQDSSFMYRIYNIDEMLNRLEGFTLWFGHGIGSNYEVVLYGLKNSFFLDNTFVTLLYKIGVVGTIFLISILFYNYKRIPKDIFYFELFSLIIIASISYHIILNPVFLLGYFIILNYYRIKN